MKSELHKRIYSVISLLALVTFVMAALSQVFSRGICCADDAWYSVIAKNLAAGLGYTQTIPSMRLSFFSSQFDPYVGSGPMLILPASLLIKLFGNTYWAPGLSSVICWAILLVLIWLLARKYTSGIGLTFAVLTFLFLCFASTSFDFEQWFALLGEVPAALFIILGILLFLTSDSRWRKILGGVAFALAVLEKPLSVLAFVAFLAAMAIIYLLDRHRKLYTHFSDFLRNAFRLTIGFIIPLLLFETWKFVALGPLEYVQRWKAFFSLSAVQGVNLISISSLFGLYKLRAGALFERFGIFLPGLIFVFILVWIVIRKNRDLVYLFIALESVVIFYSIWWIFLSIGWTRYYFTPLLASFAVVSLPFLLPFSRKWIFLLYCALIIILSSYNWDRLAFPFSRMDNGLFQPTQQTLALIKVKKLLAPFAGKEPIVTQWWATGTDIEYIMDSHLVFTHYKDVDAIGSKSFLIAVNTNFLLNDDLDFASLLERCTDKQWVNIYLIAKCDSIITK